jgi:transposase
MEHDSTVYVGLDVHKESITVAYAIGMGDVELFGKIGTAKSDIERLCKRLRSKGRHVRIVYEAGPCGYGLFRQLVERGFECMVCAPSLIPRKPGERVKTDRRDAMKLVRALRAGDLSAVHVPTVEDEAFRDLARTWAASREALRQARQRLKSFLLAHGVRYTGRADWSEAHRRWLSSYSFVNAWQQLAFEGKPSINDAGQRVMERSEELNVVQRACSRASARRNHRRSEREEGAGTAR